ncbi:MAG: SPOR domain-containing protein [Planctomycetes bacterium]|nr:SPOR domain-containing protein [Planctomycetota bacterium]
MGQAKMAKWAAILVLLAAAGCGGQIDPESQKIIDKASAAYEAKDDKAVIAEMDQFLARKGSAKYSAPGWQVRGKAKLRLGDKAGAEWDLAQASMLTRDDALRAETLVMLGDIAFDKGDPAGAKNRYGQALELLSKGKKLHDHALLRMGCVLQCLGNWEDADLYLQRVDYLYPDGESACQARLIVNARAWTALVGQYDDEAAAKLESRRLTEKGLAAFIQPAVRNDRLVYLVMAGRHQTRQQAQAAMPAVLQAAPQAALDVTK